MFSLKSAKQNTVKGTKNYVIEHQEVGQADSHWKMCLQHGNNNENLRL